MAEEKTEAVLLNVPSGAWDAVFGHERTRARLARLLREGRVPHALLFSGPKGVGKKRTALALSALVLREPVTLPVAVGAALILGATLASQTEPKRIFSKFRKKIFSKFKK